MPLMANAAQEFGLPFSSTAAPSRKTCRPEPGVLGSKPPRCAGTAFFPLKRKNSGSKPKYIRAPPEQSVLGPPLGGGVCHTQGSHRGRSESPPLPPSGLSSLPSPGAPLLGGFDRRRSD